MIEIRKSIYSDTKAEYILFYLIYIDKMLQNYYHTNIVGNWKGFRN